MVSEDATSSPPTRGGFRPPTDEDWEQRTLCSDGNCIGIIGPDGRCKECGKPFDGEVSAPAYAHGDDELEAEPEPDALDATDRVTPVSESDDPDWASRRLCSDGNCIGVIGPDGRCKECGKPYQGN